MKTVKAVGLKWYKRGTSKIPVWVADERDVKKGYYPKTVNLQHIADQPKVLVAECNALQNDMLLWRSGHRRSAVVDFEGTVRALLNLYKTHQRSPYRKLTLGSRMAYDHYLSKLCMQIGDFRINEITGAHISNWYQIWSANGQHPAAATTARAVFGAAIRFGTILRLDGCPELGAALDETMKKLRKQNPTLRKGRKGKEGGGPIPSLTSAARKSAKAAL